MIEVADTIEPITELINTAGSVWRKWDLHVHTPLSKLHNEFTNWEAYLEALENLTDVSVLGITDYYSIEGYQQLAKYKRDGNLKNIDLLLPNVEMRIDTVTARERPINIHVIFSPDIVDYLPDKFFRELQYEYGGRTFSCTKSELIELGRMAKSSRVGEEEAYREGMNQFKVSIDKLTEVFQKNKSIFSGKYITVVANKSTDGASGLRESSMKIEQRKIYRFADAIFSSRPGDRAFFLGEAENHSKQMIIENFSSLKPCIHGSDAHSLEKLCKPEMNRFTWIKAEPTFNGLLQIIHEPKDRVIIQEEHPDKKSGYNIIESVRFLGNDGCFSDKKIKLNSGLNTIIGGKSSGKSLLLYKIAQAISLDEIKKRDDYWKNPYSSSFIEGVDFEITWRTGKVSNVGNSNGNVTYIPQMYINSLSEDTANDDLQQKIKEILTQKEENASFFSKQRESLKNFNAQVSYNVVRLFEKISDLKIINEKIKKVGDKNSITLEISKLEHMVAEKIKGSNLTEAEESEMNRLQNAKEGLTSLITRETSSLQKSEYVSKELVFINDHFNKSLKDLYIDLKDEYATILDELGTTINAAFVKALGLFNEKKESFLLWEKQKIEEGELLTQQLQPFINKLQQLTDITEIRTRIDEQDKLLKQIEEYEETKRELTKAIESLQKDVLWNFEQSFELLHQVKEFFNDKEEFIDLKLISQIQFDYDKFDSTFLSIFNRRGKITNIFPQTNQCKIFDENDVFIFSEETYLKSIKSLFEHLLAVDDSNLKLKKGFTRQQAIQYLLSSSFTKVIFDLSKDGDNLSQMSPGKRGLVLLELYLGMSQEKYPILIDQPEDNLDNRTISKELVDFIKKKKIDRQIIIVTHNANLVVLTDAENVIVANQDTQLNENEACRFEYITGALECDFIQEGSTKITGRGIKSHVCEILEGGQEAFEIRERKYGF